MLKHLIKRTERKPLNFLPSWMEKMTWMLIFSDSRHLQLPQNGIKLDGLHKLNALLSGRALDVYSRLSEEAALDYGKMKIALMKRYDLTEDGYMCKFRFSSPETDESPDQFIVRLSTYNIRWLELSKTEKTFEGLKDLIVKEQFINTCPKELAVHCA